MPRGKDIGRSYVSSFLSFCSDPLQNLPKAGDHASGEELGVT